MPHIFRLLRNEYHLSAAKKSHSSQYAACKRCSSAISDASWGYLPHPMFIDRPMYKLHVSPYPRLALVIVSTCIDPALQHRRRLKGNIKSSDLINTWKPRELLFFLVRTAIEQAISAESASSCGLEKHPLVGDQWLKKRV